MTTLDPETPLALHDGRSRMRALTVRFASLGLIGAISLAVMAPVRLNGDQVSYVAGARAIGMWLRSLVGVGSFEGSVVDDLVQNGWFMPGVSVLLSPIFLVAGAGVPTVAIRVCMLVANLAVLWAIATQINRRWGTKAECAYLAVLIVSPNYVLFLSTAWSDLLAVHLALLGLFWVHDHYFDPVSRSSALREGALAGSIVAGLTYLRGLYPIYLGIVAAAAALRLAAGAFSRTRVNQFAVSVVSATAVAALLLAPWVLTVSARFGPTMTVTSSSISNIAWKADPEFLAEARRISGETLPFRALQEVILARAAADGVSYREAAADIEAEVSAGISWPEQVQLYRGNVQRFLAFDDATPHMNRFFELRCESEQGCLPAWSSEVLRFWADWGWRVLLIVGAAIFAIPYRLAQPDDAYLAFLWKALVLSLAIHPFLVLTHARYYNQFVPLIAFGIALAVAGSAPLLRRADILAEPAPRSVLNTAGQALAVAFTAVMAYLALT